MNSSETVQYKFTADYRGYTQVTSADGTVTENRYDTITREVKVDVRVNFVGELELYSKEKFQIDSLIENVRDYNGEEIYENGRWRVNQTMPRLSPLGLKQDYAYRAVMISGQI